MENHRLFPLRLENRGLSFLFRQPFIQLALLFVHDGLQAGIIQALVHRINTFRDINRTGKDIVIILVKNRIAGGNLIGHNGRVKVKTKSLRAEEGGVIFFILLPNIRVVSFPGVAGKLVGIGITEVVVVRGQW